MPTVNINAGPAWVKVADAGQDFLMSTNTDIVVEVATTTADAAPAVTGHRMNCGFNREALTRTAIGAGYVWAKLIFPEATAVLVVSK